ncbi:hypothetical protein EYF80_015144 [Liparis tanakae]|uniref:Uncharacterized protein n=1 Tax=Liparis tanakae TaxID=230148 RepID=A0A4Z2I9I1_9TELE|nr:hypothetical protein EYF80_015144 [Liparis tanakae]
MGAFRVLLGSLHYMGLYMQLSGSARQPGHGEVENHISGNGRRQASPVCSSPPARSHLGSRLVAGPPDDVTAASRKEQLLRQNPKWDALRWAEPMYLGPDLSIYSSLGRQVLEGGLGLTTDRRETITAAAAYLRMVHLTSAQLSADLKINLAALLRALPALPALPAYPQAS